MPETKYTFCRICESSCGLEVDVEDNRILKIRPNPEHVTSKGYACKKGLCFHEIVHSPDRVLQPQKRTGDRWDPLSWDEAFSEIGEKIRALVKKYGPDAVALYAGNGAGFNIFHPLFAKGFMSAIGSRSLYSSASLDCSNKFAVADEMYGSPLLQTFPDIDRSGCLIMLGANPAASRFSFGNIPRVLDRLKDIEKRGGRIFHLNPRRTETARVAGEQIFIRPGTDVYFLLAFARALIYRNAMDSGRIKRYMKNFDQLMSFVQPWTVERAATVTGIEPETIERLVDCYAGSVSSSLYCSTGVNMNKNSTIAYWLIEAINAFSGNLDKPGGMLVGKGFIDLPKLANRQKKPSVKPVRVRGFQPVMEAYPSAILADQIIEEVPGKVRCLIVTGGNPALAIPDQERTRRALSSLELLVSVDIFRNETGNLSHYLLPGITFMEHADINFLFQSMMGIMNIPFIQYTDPVVPTAGETKDEIWIFTRLMRACGKPLFGSRLAQALLGLGNLIESLRGRREAGVLTQERLFGWLLRLAKLPGVTELRKEPHGRLLGALTGGDFLGERVLTADGRVNLAPAAIINSIEARTLEHSWSEELRLKRNLKLVNMRESLTHNTYLHNAPSLMSGRPVNALHINPYDAADRGLRTGDRALVKSAHGSVEIAVLVTDEMMQGSVAIPHGWGHAEADGLRVASANGGVNVNRLTAAGAINADSISGMAHLSGIFVEVMKN